MSLNDRREKELMPSLLMSIYLSTLPLRFSQIVLTHKAREPRQYKKNRVAFSSLCVEGGYSTQEFEKSRGEAA